MQILNFSKRDIAWITVIIIGLLLGATIAGAQEGTMGIYACVMDANGAIRIVDENDTCRNNEYPLEWNTQDPAGGLNNHYQKSIIIVDPNQTKPVPLPVNDQPIQINVSVSAFDVDCGNSIIETLGPGSFMTVYSLDSSSGLVSHMNNNIDGVAQQECASTHAGSVYVFIWPNENLDGLVIGNASYGDPNIISPIEYVVTMWY